MPPLYKLIQHVPFHIILFFFPSANSTYLISISSLSGPYLQSVHQLLSANHWGDVTSTCKKLNSYSWNLLICSSHCCGSKLNWKTSFSSEIIPSVFFHLVWFAVTFKSGMVLLPQPIVLDEWLLFVFSSSILDPKLKAMLSITLLWHPPQIFWKIPGKC